ncbi:hypothetical protein [Microbulbifer rhizosphaerae]|uniref:Uncharacterized protein n=1 Tax=Microbulbifer rhizosphaerae TaxID=1562603 RepID=A0A7W4W833_9GAMM|nr:hypothetical protein [Microbulbifer rhizosphaerae]MBB3059430.1 hypothetical protein [Microbulbifer rhizosphaerae]
MNSNKPSYTAHLLLGASISLTGAFALWIYSDSSIERANQVVQTYDQLYYEGKKEQAAALLRTTLNTSDKGPLGPEWIAVVRRMDNGYEQLQQLLRIVAAAPRRETTYREIAELLASAPENFNIEQRHRYLAALNGIDGVEQRLLDRYALQLDFSEDSVK